MLGGPSEKNQAKDIISIDNRYGISINGANGGDVVIKKSSIWGEHKANQDCYGVNNEDCDHCFDRWGLIFASMYSNETGHQDRVHNWHELPMFNYSDSFEGTVLYKDIKFKKFDNKTTTCGSQQAAIGPYWK